MLLRYPGGKYKIRKKLLPFLPKNYSSYIEPFCGGAGLYWEIPTNKSRWLNDINNDLINFYWCVQSQFPLFRCLCNNIQIPLLAEKKDPPIYNERMKAVFNKLVNNETFFFKSDMNIYKALKYFYINRTVWGGRVNYELKSRLYFSNPNGWNIIKTDKLEKAHNILQRTKLTNRDWHSVLLDVPQNSFVFIDPPYVKNSGLSKTSQLYKDNFTEEDHTNLRLALKDIPYKVMITYDDCPLIRYLYGKGTQSTNEFWDITEMSWTYSGTPGKKRKGNELIIRNYQ